MIDYSTNWMGPINAKWIGGRIDIRNVPDEPYGLEFSLPLIDEKDFGFLQDFLDDYETQEVVTFEKLIQDAERIKTLDPENDWCSFEGALNFVNKLIIASLNNPNKVWEGD